MEKNYVHPKYGVAYISAFHKSVRLVLRISRKYFAWVSIILEAPTSTTTLRRSCGKELGSQCEAGFGLDASGWHCHLCSMWKNTIGDARFSVTGMYVFQSDQKNLIYMYGIGLR